ncbi:pyridoxamine 5'-phosphate oxidase [Opitutales bacterium]|jgi:pyridoxamine 5'-phosphate oxidase|nr:pyridoxamine 5'-phosphate oxidase [Opitutales bacterium]MDB2357780.1 pyridoxamine 5'-phosphate oxidase [Opitutales bacterium]MDB2506590.1 pyridoxamine 5'-phosphate oxidase [Opitutales bacterium]MDB2682158.1 pyridoxamine 5'-phosphate oxidase [Opitutales bacterium]
MDHISDLREDYTKHALRATDLSADPFAQFEQWFQQAEECDVQEPNAMCLASVSADGQPSTRVVLLKAFSSKGLVFYTNYESRKASELEANPKVAANFLWLPLQRQVNVTGRVERVSKVEALKYFISRPLASRLGAWSSPQSQMITSRQILEAKLDQMKRKFADGEVPLPDHWGGYRIVPETFEFWQGGSGRLHDRFMYRLDAAGGWTPERLAP